LVGSLNASTSETIDISAVMTINAIGLAVSPTGRNVLVTAYAGGGTACLVNLTSRTITASGAVALGAVVLTSDTAGFGITLGHPCAVAISGGAIAISATGATYVDNGALGIIGTTLFGIETDRFGAQSGNIVALDTSTLAMDWATSVIAVGAAVRAMTVGHDGNVWALDTVGDLTGLSVAGGVIDRWAVTGTVPPVLGQLAVSATTAYVGLETGIAAVDLATGVQSMLCTAVLCDLAMSPDGKVIWGVDASHQITMVTVAGAITTSTATVTNPTAIGTVS
jgi:hypothetical protein